MMEERELSIEEKLIKKAHQFLQRKAVDGQVPLKIVNCVMTSLLTKIENEYTELAWSERDWI